MKILRSILISAIYLVILIAVYLLHVRFFQVNVVLYSALFDVFVAAGLATILLIGFEYFKLLSHLEKFQLVIIWLLSGYILAISVPTLIDRSLSFYFLEKIQQRGGGIYQDALEEIFTKEFVEEHRLVDARLTEQQASGTITIENGCVKLTAWGDSLASFSRMFRQNYLPKKRQLMGEITDDLTDPFRNSTNVSEYECE